MVRVQPRRQIVPPIVDCETAGLRTPGVSVQLARTPTERVRGPEQRGSRATTSAATSAQSTRSGSDNRISPGYEEAARAQVSVTQELRCWRARVTAPRRRTP